MKKCTKIAAALVAAGIAAAGTAPAAALQGRPSMPLSQKPPRGISFDDGRGGFIRYRPPKEPIGGSTVDGRITVVDNGNGTHTVTNTDDQGKKTVVVNPNPSARPPIHYVSPKEPIGGSTVDGKTTVVDNGNGTHTVTSTDDQGKKTVVVNPNPSARPPIHYVSPKEPIGGSTVDGRITVVDNGNGTHTVTTHDNHGSRPVDVNPNPSARPPIHYVSPKEPIGGSTVDGRITVVDNGNGTHTVTTPDEQGNRTSVVNPNPSAMAPGR